MTIKEITLVFENCEFVDIPIKDVNFICLNDLERNISVKDSYIRDYYVANKVFIQLRESAKTLTTSFSSMYKENCNLEQRLEGNDITQVIIRKENNEEETYYVIWDDGEDEFTNKYQTYQKEKHFVWKDDNSDFTEEEMLEIEIKGDNE